MNNTNLREYGDVENIKADLKTLNEILGRQGQNLFVDVLAEAIGNACLIFKLNALERERLLDGACADLKNAISERI